MELDPIAAYVATVPTDRTIQLPEDVPVGATVAVLLLPSHVSADDDVARRERFARTRAALRAAAERKTHPAAVDDATLDALIDRARRA